MTSAVGESLKTAREERGLSIAEVAQSLKFAPRQIEALEQDRFDLLPGGTFVRGMVRSYARLLKLPAEPMLEGMADKFQAPDANTLAARYSQPVPFSDNARRSTFVYLGLSLAVLALGGGVAYQWYREHNTSTQLAAAKRTAEKRAKSNPAPVAAVAPAPAPAPTPVATAPRSQPKTLEQSARVEPPVVKVATEKTPAPKPAAVAKIPDKAAPPAEAKVASAGLHRLVIRCEEEAWIEVKDQNERMLVSSLNPKGAERVVQARGPLTLVIGNAAHVRVLHNDRPIDLTPHTKLAIARFTLP
ncbi:MAG TPA: RodZ domain-containing protein [Burkholderiales bacterium]|jgi:cytoskeleton protein RodZ|nr:RodZ domain-containing protein [Burkholderiales bacterium]